MRQTVEKVTFCRICEPFCGLVARIEDDELTQLRPDPDNPASKGFACARGLAMTDIQNDADRVTHPLRKKSDGQFERVSWNLAMRDIARRFRRIRREHGADAIGWYMGNPSGASYSHLLWTLNFMRMLGSPHFYSVGSQDQNSRLAASALLYGSPVTYPIPDLDRTQFLLMVGANPRVSQGSGISVPRIGEAIKGIEARGGRVVVVDPRRTPTAKAHEWLPINPDTDAAMLLSLLQVLFEERLVDSAAIERIGSGLSGLRTLCAAYTPESTEDATGIPAQTLRQLARDLAAAPRAAVYGRFGACVGRFGTLVSFLLDVLNVVTGNLDKAGGAVFANSPIALDSIVRRLDLASYATRHSRVGGFPDVVGTMPSSLIAHEIQTPGKGQLRALFVSAGNPVLSSPNGAELEQALPKLELMVSIDLYQNETNQHADYILPATTFLERDDVPVFGLSEQLRPFIQSTEAVLPPRGEARQEWKIIDELTRRSGLGILPSPIGGLMRHLGLAPTPRQLLDWILRTGPQGDWFGLRRGGLSLAKLARHPHGLMLDGLKTGVLRKKISHRSGKLRLDPPEIAFEIRRLQAAMKADADPAFPMRLIGMRESRSHNSWMHNSQRLMRGERRVTAKLNPEDANTMGLQDGDDIQVTSKTGHIRIPVEVTEDIKVGTVAIPHGWGHKGGWHIANASTAPNINALTSTRLEDIERLAGMTHLSGVPVRVKPLPSKEFADN